MVTDDSKISLSWLNIRATMSEQKLVLAIYRASWSGRSSQNLRMGIGKPTCSESTRGSGKKNQPSLHWATEMWGYKSILWYSPQLTEDSLWVVVFHRFYTNVILSFIITSFKNPDAC